MVRTKAITEAQWLASSNSYEMLPTCRPIIREHPRKGRLFAVACCDRIWDLLTDKRSRASVDAAASFADGLIGEQQLEKAEMAARAAHAEAFEVKGKVDASAEWAAQFAASLDTWFAASRASNFAYVAAGDGIMPGAEHAPNSVLLGDVFGIAEGDPIVAFPEHAAQSVLLRDIFGNPFRPVAIDPKWLTPTVVALAQSIYDARTFDCLPELANALVDAGCDNHDILGHCRSDKPHVRGCWAVDLVLGKE